MLFEKITTKSKIALCLLGYLREEQNIVMITTMLFLSLKMNNALNKLSKKQCKDIVRVSNI